MTGIFRDTSFVAAQLKRWGLTSELLNLTFDVVLVVVISALIACITMSLIAAISGASCSSMEDMESANMTSTMIILACYMATVIAAPFGSSPAVFMSLCPFISAFAAPAYYITGDIGFMTVIVSWAIQAVCVGLIYKMSGKLYDSLIMYKGSRLKAGKIIKMALNRREGK